MMHLIIFALISSITTCFCSNIFAFATVTTPFLSLCHNKTLENCRGIKSFAFLFLGKIFKHLSVLTVFGIKLAFRVLLYTTYFYLSRLVKSILTPGPIVEEIDTFLT